MFNEKWPILPDVHNTDSTSNLVSILLGHGINDETICQTVPKCVDVNAIFLVNTSEFSNLDDVKCDDNGSWINNGVRQLYLSVTNEADQKLLKVTTIQRGGKPPEEKHWCLIRTYFLCKASKDFKKMIVSLQGMF